MMHLRNRVSSTVIVRNLDRSTSEMQLFELMSGAGEVRFCRIIRHKDSCTGDVMFVEEDAAMRAIATLNGSTSYYNTTGRVIMVCVVFGPDVRML